MTSPSYYTPKSPSVIDTVAYTQRVVDAMLRNNPLHNATIDEGLMKWIGNYASTTNQPSTNGVINYLWIGEFSPNDSNLPGNPPQKGFSLVRDDSRGGTAAIQLYDPNAQDGDGLKQQLLFGSGDGHHLMREAREGGVQWPQENVWMGSRDSDLALWPGNTGAGFSAIYEGRVNIIGRSIHYRVWDACTGGASGSFRLRVEGVGAGGVDVTSPVHVLGVNGNGVWDGVVDVGSGDGRGRTVPIYWEAKVDNAVGKARASVISVRCHT